MNPLVQFIEFSLIGIASGGAYIIAALGFVIIFKAGNVFNFAMGEMMMFGAFLFYGAVVQETIRHDDDPRLTRHLSNAVTRETRDGAYITKETRDSPRRIDLAVASVMAYDRAITLAGARAKEPLIAWR